MFHEGDLQSGIALAIQESKSVACFVRDESEESLTWENEWLQDDSISQLLSSRSVVLRIQAGSQEAGFLAAFCPVGVVPALALIHNGQLLDVLVKGVEKEEFERRVGKVFVGETAISATSTDTPPSNPPPAQVQAPVSPPPTSSTPNTSAQTLRAESAAKAEAKGKGRADAAPATAASTPTPAPAQARNDWLKQQRHRQSEARRERERVMAQIEADKAERKVRREEEKKAKDQATSESTSPKPTPVGGTSKATTSNLQVRLLDGGTIRKQFPATATLEVDVRPWIDEHLETKAPYTFKHIIPPQPARAISVGEEHESLRELDLLPSATLVLQSVQDYSEAYAPTSGGILSLPYNVVTGTFGLVSGTLTGAARWLRGGQYEIPEGQDERGGHILGDNERVAEAGGNEARGGGSMRIRTLADARMDGGRDQREFYNGNSLDFQPSVEDEEDETASRRR